MASLRQPLKWHGGKHYLAPWLMSIMKTVPHLHYVEPYFGGGAVLLARDPNRDWMATGGERLPARLRGCSEVVNDINYRLMNFWECLQDPEAFEVMRRTLSVTPFSATEFAKALENADRIELLDTAFAVSFFVQYRQSRQGLGKDFATLTRNRTRGGRNEQANAWLSCIEGLPEIHKRLKGVVILNDDALKVIKQQDDGNTLFYCDPPYLHSTRSSTGEYGENEMTEDDHTELLVTLGQIKGKFMLSGYHSSLYDRIAKSHGWNCYERVIDIKASSAAVKEKRTECVWTNFNP